MIDSGIKHIVWDWNGTLLDDVSLCRAALNHLLAQRGLPPVSAETHAQHFGFPLKPYYARVGFDFGREDFNVVSEQFMEFYEARRSQCPVRKGAEQALLRLKARNYSQSLLSAYNQSLLRRLILEKSLQGHFDSVTGTDNLNAEGKIERGQTWLKQSGFRADQVLFIGDTLHDAELARQLGAPCILIESGHQSRERLLNSGCPVIREFDELFAAVA